MIKLSQKKTCENCKAIYQSQYVDRCELGYSFDKHFKPTEPCPKPKTFMELIECRELYMKL